jgi:DNA-binding response OmpR family regulator
VSWRSLPSHRFAAELKKFSDLPLSVDDAQPRPAVLYARKQTAMNEPNHAHRVLMVEDNESISDILSFILERENFEVELAKDGREAQRRIQEGAPPDVVLLDVMLPYVSGFQLVSAIRELAEWRDVPVIMLTGKSHENDIADALNAGADDYIVKPFHPTELMARLRRLVRREAR